jgi:hypothetical protein
VFMAFVVAGLVSEQAASISAPVTIITKAHIAGHAAGFVGTAVADLIVDAAIAVVYVARIAVHRTWHLN